MPLDIWADGALSRKGAAEFFGCCETTFKTIDRAEKFPRKWLGGKVVFAKVALQAYLDALPDVPPKGVVSRVKRMRA